MRTREIRRILMTVTLLALAAFAMGCASDSEKLNQSSRPWNSPRGWEGNLPFGINEGR